MSGTAQSPDAMVERIIAGEVPDHIRAAAARGALPLPRPILVRLWVHLRGDADPEIAAAAESSLGDLDGAAVREVLAQPDCPGEVLGHFAGAAEHEPEIAESIVFNRATPDAVLKQLAAGGNSAVVELVLTNQERLLQQPGLLDGLMANPALRAGQRGRILELLERISRASSRQEGDEVQDDDEATAAAYEEAARLLEVDVGQLLSASEIVDGDEFADSEVAELRNAYQRVVSMNTAQKAILAMKGGREERMILIRDTNKVVSLGVLRNPRVKDEEVAGIARMRNVAEDVLRGISQKRDWMKKYGVVHALVTNPRTPQAVSTNLVSRLTTKDLRNLAGSREVPELLRRMARRTYEMRTAPKGNFRKK